MDVNQIQNQRALVCAFKFFSTCLAAMRNAHGFVHDSWRTVHVAENILNFNLSGRVKGRGRGEFFLYSRIARNLARSANARILLLNSRLSFNTCLH